MASKKKIEDWEENIYDVVNDAFAHETSKNDKIKRSNDMSVGCNQMERKIVNEKEERNRIK